MKNKSYKITDGNATETASTLHDAASIAEDWYNYMVDEGRIPNACNPDLNDSRRYRRLAPCGCWATGRMKIDA